jgi:predicted hydrocarbon binding protein
MHPPDVSIDIDRDTGHWTTNGLPMLYMPRHFFMGIIETVEAAIGREAADRHFYKAGFDAAFQWCHAESGRSGFKGMDVFHHYMNRLSQRGWGMFDGSAINPKTGVGTVVLRHSSFVAHFGRGSGRQVCYVCGGWAPGALAWVSQTLGADWRLAGREGRCAAEGHEHCELLVFDSRQERGGPSSAEAAVHPTR